MRKPKYIIFVDNILNKYCSDINAFTVFEYYMKKNLTNAYYIVNFHSKLYNYLLNKNKTKNIISFENNNYLYYNKLFEYLLNSKIIVTSYDQTLFRLIINKVSFIKYLYINHGITYFKSDFEYIKPELNRIEINKRNIITSSPYEYSILTKKFNYSSQYIYKAGLARYDNFYNKKTNKSCEKCILAFFTYRHYNKTLFEKSLYKINLEKMINDEVLMNYLKLKKIKFILIQHHLNVYQHKTIHKNSSSYFKISDHIHLTDYIMKCSLFITDFSSISFAFMFQNKPTLFYLLDIKDNIDFEEKKYLKINDLLPFGNYFLDQKQLIKKIKYYIKKDFKISKKLKSKYESAFYYKYNITERIYEIINQIIKT